MQCPAEHVDRIPGGFHPRVGGFRGWVPGARRGSVPGAPSSFLLVPVLFLPIGLLVVE